MEVFPQFVEFLRVTFGLSAFEVLVVALFLVALVIVGYAVNKFGLVEAVSHRKLELQLLGEFLLDNIVLMAKGTDVDFSKYEERASQRQEDGLSYIDPRMLWLLDKGDDYVSGRVGFNVSFDELYAKAEAIYQQFKDSQPVEVGREVSN